MQAVEVVVATEAVAAEAVMEAVAVAMEGAALTGAAGMGWDTAARLMLWRSSTQAACGLAARSSGPTTQTGRTPVPGRVRNTPGSSR